MDWRQILCFPDEMCQLVVAALQRPEDYTDKVKDVGGSIEGPVHYVSCNTAITFTNYDLLFGSKLHNRPLSMTSYIRE